MIIVAEIYRGRLENMIVTRARTPVMSSPYTCPRPVERNNAFVTRVGLCIIVLLALTTFV